MISLSDEGLLLEAEHRGFRADEMPPADPVMFRLALIMKDETTEDLQRDASAALLRQIALRISAERDIPLDDWTRPIPPGGTLSDSFTNYLRASLTADDEPRWRC